MHCYPEASFARTFLHSVISCLHRPLSPAARTEENMSYPSSPHWKPGDQGDEGGNLSLQGWFNAPGNAGQPSPIAPNQDSVNMYRAVDVDGMFGPGALEPPYAAFPPVLKPLLCSDAFERTVTTSVLITCLRYKCCATRMNLPPNRNLLGGLGGLSLRTDEREV